ncbi:MerR family transcriptional regulator [Streptomyces uncialis]|uniref:MerR family transcriptional regulator n=1 Tax=Streptomyces uncialis TaxID=1048205 RepID=UPI00224F6654|nr:MerR family transcriptional regulator [Streptomyces uncialis]MCX4662243.1 MerR family transcriptional regulator [Streptomyces uncialis]
MTMRMRIGELAERVGASTRSLRYYEQQGLLSPTRDSNGYREYDETALVRARNIKELLAVGLTTEDVLHYLERGCLEQPLAQTPRCAGESDTIHRRLESLDHRIARLQELRDRLARHSATVDAAVDSRQTPKAPKARETPKAREEPKARRARET